MLDGTFFGLIVKPNKRYATTVKETFRITKACLELSTAGDKASTLFAEYDSEEYIIANFDKTHFNETLDLGFSAGEKIAFKVEGPGTIHVTGNIIDDEPDFTDSMMEDESSEDETDEQILEKLKSAKRKKLGDNSSAKKIKLDKAAMNGQGDEDSDDSDDSSDDDSDDGETTLGDLDSTNNFAEEEDSDDDSGEEEEEDDDDDDEDDEDDDDDDDSEEEEEEETPVKMNGDSKAKKSPKKEEKPVLKTPNKDSKPKENGKTPKQDVKTPKQDVKTPKQDVKTPKQDAKTPKQEAKTPKQDAKTPKQDGKTPKQDKAKTPKAEAKTPKSLKQENGSATPMSQKKMKNGLIIEDLKEGNGPECKPGKTVGMYYSGRLKSNNKQFDSCSSGKPFKFKLGKGEVIKGWDIGVVGMKVGGKRRITAPPNMGYGAGGAPPDIPGNSTLVFEVECKFVN